MFAKKFVASAFLIFFSAASVASVAVEAHAAQTPGISHLSVASSTNTFASPGDMGWQ